MIEVAAKKPANAKAKAEPGARFAKALNTYNALPDEVRAIGQEQAASREVTNTSYERDAAEAEKRRRQFIAKARYTFSRSVSDGNCDAALVAAEDILSCKEEIPNDLMLQLLLLSTNLSGAERFAKAINVSGRGGIRLTEHDFAAIIGRLLSRDAPHAMIRAALNFGLAPDAEVLPLVPDQVDKEEDVKSCFVGAEFDDGEDVSDEDEAPAPKMLEATGFKGCALKLNGLYKRASAYPGALGNNRRTYMKPGRKDCVFAYFYQRSEQNEEGAPDQRTGWYLGSEIGGKGTTYAYLGSASLQPPSASKWSVKLRDGTWVTKPQIGSFDEPSAKTAEGENDDDAAQRAMSEIDLSQLRGKIVGRDAETARYFGHFFVLLNLEHLSELFGFRVRWRFRSTEELVGFGLCFKDLPVEQTFSPKQASLRMPLPGWPDVGNQSVVFKLPRGVTEDSCRLKKGESVVVSRGDPISQRIAEGSVKDIDFMTRSLTVSVNGKMPDDPKQKMLFRVDVFANRTTYERQATALLEFVTAKRSRICDMLVAASVGKVDLAVLGGDGFQTNKDGQHAAKNTKKEDKDSKPETSKPTADGPDVSSDVHEGKGPKLADPPDKTEDSLPDDVEEKLQHAESEPTRSKNKGGDAKRKLSSDVGDKSKEKVHMSGAAAAQKAVSRNTSGAAAKVGFREGDPLDSLPDAGETNSQDEPPDAIDEEAIEAAEDLREQVTNTKCRKLDSPHSQEGEQLLKDPHSPHSQEAPRSPHSQEAPGSPHSQEVPGSPHSQEAPRSPHSQEAPHSPLCRNQPGSHSPRSPELHSQHSPQEPGSPHSGQRTPQSPRSLRSGDDGERVEAEGADLDREDLGDQASDARSDPGDAAEKENAATVSVMDDILKSLGQEDDSALGAGKDTGSAAATKASPDALELELAVEEDPDEIEKRKEEEIKKRTLAIADETADGVDPAKFEEAIVETAALADVSDTQRDAILNSMSKRLTIVQGPPGTGKTHTSVRILTMWAQVMGYKPLLATSECNIAVDNIAEGLVKAGVKVVRVGRPEKVREHLELSCLDNMVKADRLKRKEEAEENDESDVELGEEPLDYHGPEWLAWSAKRCSIRSKRAWNSKQDNWARARFLDEAQVICATTISSGSKALSAFKFHGILIDEVAQATETSSIVPIVMRGARQLVLCGDHCQLPPSVQSREAEMRGYSLSLYSRLVEAGVPFRFLDTQYRAHPMLMEFSAHSIYQDKLKHGIDGSKRPQPIGIPWPNPKCPAAFFESSVEEHLDGESKANSVEADVVCDLVKGVLAAGELDMSGIGIVTPYKGQVRTLRRKLFAAIPGSEESRDLEVASVDNFQGREKELIIFSAVRCNNIGSVGFLADWRRLNVMITRARRGIVVIGHAETLCSDAHWKLWMQFTEKQGGAPAGTVATAMEAVNARKERKGKGKGKGKKGHHDSETHDVVATAAAPEKEVIEMQKKRKKLASIAEQMEDWSTWDVEKKPKKKKAAEADEKAYTDEEWALWEKTQAVPTKKKKKAVVETESWGDVWPEDAPAKKKMKAAEAWPEEEASPAAALQTKKKKQKADETYTDEDWAKWEKTQAMPKKTGAPDAKSAGARAIAAASAGKAAAARAFAVAKETVADDGEFNWGWAESYTEAETTAALKKKQKQKQKQEQQW